MKMADERSMDRSSSTYMNLGGGLRFCDTQCLYRQPGFLLVCIYNNMALLSTLFPDPHPARTPRKDQPTHPPTSSIFLEAFKGIVKAPLLQAPPHAHTAWRRILRRKRYDAPGMSIPFPRVTHVTYSVVRSPYGYTRTLT